MIHKKPEVWIVVYPVNGGPELQAYQFGSHKDAEIQQEIYVQSQLERNNVSEYDQDYGNDRDFHFSETLLFQVNTASLNIQQIILELVCGGIQGGQEIPSYSECEYLIERLLPDYDHNMYKFLLDSQWDKLYVPQYPTGIRAQSENISYFPPYSVRNENDDWIAGGFRTFDQAVDYAVRKLVHYSEQGESGLVFYIQNGHENTVYTVDEEEIE